MRFGSVSAPTLRGEKREDIGVKIEGERARGQEERRRWC
jgi:hypothetical protein